MQCVQALENKPPFERQRSDMGQCPIYQLLFIFGLFRIWQNFLNILFNTSKSALSVPTAMVRAMKLNQK